MAKVYFLLVALFLVYGNLCSGKSVIEDTNGPPGTEDASPIDQFSKKSSDLLSDLTQEIQDPPGTANDGAEDLFEGDIAMDDHVRKLVSGQVSDSVVGKLWPRKTVYYVLDRNLGNLAVQAIKAAIAHISRETCIRFINKKSVTGYVRFFVGNGCYSYVGHQRREQDISIGRGCETMGIVAHEILHALGFWHEQSRKDRDQYVTINWNNIRAGKAHNFNKHLNSHTLGAPYDYNSLMHYGRRSFSKNGRDTITPKKSGAAIGQRDGLSRVDIWQVRKRYSCPGPLPTVTPLPNVKVRLVGGRTPYEGRVEVFWGVWGSVCDDHFDINDAHVVCKQLGYKAGAQADFCCSKFGAGRGPIHLDDVQCKGGEKSIAQCKHRGWGSHNCRRNEHAGVRCIPNSNIKVRLVGGMLSNMGRVEIFHNNKWGTVCDDNWDIKDGHVVCRMLGYKRAEKALPRAACGRGSGQIWLDNVQCSGRESSIDYCAHKPWGKHNCGHHEDAGVVCEPRNPVRVRLAGSRVRGSGRVEVLYNGVWGTVCDDFWDIRDAKVVCRMLGYSRAVKATHSASFGQGSGRILLDNVMCRGTEKTIADCTHSPWGKHNCRHSEDAGVICKA
ncbi:deleted in malignant brain tumors 1 protein isoform X2 [Nematostella vectensis]|uniref:deleted in malignant brain tumors 1 protein isoform X2 n=1 Tax=Nematostella vectensis TaxID=45351 RepID=UPI002076E7E4|nr:deleted in malignant brain tumors 1 protein isoform X2 [Nematostella vectensis]